MQILANRHYGMLLTFTRKRSGFKGLIYRFSGLMWFPIGVLLL